MRSVGLLFGAFSLAAHCGADLSAQTVRTLMTEPEDARSSLSGEEIRDASPKWLGQGGLRAGDGQTAKLRVQVYKYWLEWSDQRYLPIYLLGELPTSRSGSFEDAAATLVDEFGGSINLAFGTDELTIPKPFTFEDRPEFGLKFQARAGVKVVDFTSDGDDSTQLAALGIATSSLHLALPIWGKGAEDDESPDYLPRERAGMLQAGISGSFQWSSASRYRELFDPTDLLDEELLYLNAFASIVITDHFYLDGRVNLTTSDARLDGAASFSVNYLR